MAIKAPGTDPATAILGGGRHPLESFFSPRSVALIGATESPGSVGRTVFWNLISNPFGATLIVGVAILVHLGIVAAFSPALVAPLRAYLPRVVGSRFTRR